MDNSRKRIEAMCNGELKFSSTPGIGTTVLITIPKPVTKIGGINECNSCR